MTTGTPAASETSEAATATPTAPAETPPVGKPASNLRVDIGRAAQVFLGLFCVGFSVVVLATPEISLSSFVVLLAEAVALVGAQDFLVGGRQLVEAGFTSRRQRLSEVLRSWGPLGVGALVIVLAVWAILDPQLAVTAAVFVLAGALVLQALSRLVQGSGGSMPKWLRGSLLGTGLLILLIVGLSVAFEGLALSGFAIAVGVILMVTGIQTIVTGLHPTDPRQFVILKLILFSAFYGLILINWIDLFGKTVPAYGLWLILTYMAPFMVLLVFEGWSAWPLATSLGLLVSLMNDVGYYFIGNLIFGFHQNLGPWFAGQMGLRGSQLVTIFEGGSFTIDVTSWMMGLSIYLRGIVVGLILYYWWRHPTEIVARSALPNPPAAG